MRHDMTPHATRLRDLLIYVQFYVCCFDHCIPENRLQLSKSAAWRITQNYALAQNRDNLDNLVWPRLQSLNACKPASQMVKCLQLCWPAQQQDIPFHDTSVVQKRTSMHIRLTALLHTVLCMSGQCSLWTLLYAAGGRVLHALPCQALGLDMCCF